MKMPKTVWLATLLAVSLVIGAIAMGVAPKAAFASASVAKAPSNALLRFSVPSNVSSPDELTATLPGFVQWTQGRSPRPGISCCSNYVYDPTSLFAITKGVRVKVRLPNSSGYPSDYRIDSYDAMGVYVGTAYAYDPADSMVEITGIVDDSQTCCADMWSYQGAWATRADSNSFGGSVHYSSAFGASATYTGYFRDWAWVTTTGPTHGSAAVYVDGAYVKTVSTYSAKVKKRRVVFQKSWPTNDSAQRTVEIVNLHTPGHSEVDVDAAAFIWED